MDGAGEALSSLIAKHEVLHDDLTSKPIQGVEWAIDSVVVYRTESQQKALPVLLRDLERRFSVAAERKPPHSDRPERAQEQLPFDQDGTKHGE